MAYLRQLLAYIMAFDKWPLLVTTLSTTTHQYLKVPTPAMSGGGGVTLAFWFKRVSVVYNQAGYHFLLDARSQQGGTGDSGAYMSTSEMGAGWTFTVNGVSVLPADFNFSPAGWVWVVAERVGKSWNAGELTLGCRFNNVEALGGVVLHDLRLYNRAFTPAERLDYLNPPTTGLVRRFEFRADPLTVAYDTSGNAGHAAKYNYA